MEPKTSSRGGNWFSGSLKKNPSDPVNNQHQIGKVGEKEWEKLGGLGALIVLVFAAQHTQAVKSRAGGKAKETARQSDERQRCFGRVVRYQCPPLITPCSSLSQQEPSIPPPTTPSDPHSLLSASPLWPLNVTTAPWNMKHKQIAQNCTVITGLRPDESFFHHVVTLNCKERRFIHL